MQMGQCVARNIQNALARGQNALTGKPYETFRYVDKGSMATIGRHAAIADVAGLKLSGLPAWLAWLALHLFFLIGFRNRLAALFNWSWMYFTYQRGARLITGKSQWLSSDN
jgi:NADH dehydrogenase